MSMSQWPCQPESLAEIMNEDLIRYILAGAAEKHHLPLVIIDKHQRYDPFYPRQQATYFCRRLRGGEREECPEGIRGAENLCKNWDNQVAEDALRDKNLPVCEPQLRPCWLELNDYVVLGVVAQHRFVLFTGQFIPEEQMDLAIRKIEGAIRKKLDPTSGKECLVPASQLEREQLIQLIFSQPIANEQLMDRIKQCLMDVQKQFENHWRLLRDAIEDRIYQDMVTEAQLLALSLDKDHSIDWEKVDKLLAKLSNHLGCQRAVLFAQGSYRGQNHKGKHNVLRLRASHGLDPQICQLLPHFNWNKSRIFEYGEGCIFGPAVIEVSNRGVRGSDSFMPEWIDLWYSLSDPATNCCSVIGLGGFGNLELVGSRSEFLTRLLSMLSRRLHNLQLYTEIHQAKEFNRELAEFLAHQVRSKLQSIMGFQHTALQAGRGKQSLAILEKASARISRQIQDLAMMSKVVQEEDPVLYDPDHMKFEISNLWTIIDAAIDDQSTYAENRGIEIKPEVISLPVILVDHFWFRIMLGHILNNAIKYSRKARDGHMRWIKVATDYLGTNICIFIESFGLGILDRDKERIFERGVTASERGLFEDRSGQKRGLYEAKRILIAHNGIIAVESRHFDGSPVQSENIEECITTFIVKVPLSRKGD